MLEPARTRLLAAEVGDERSLEALAPAWDALLDESSADGIFLSPDWLLCWRRHFAAHAPLRVIAVREPPATGVDVAGGARPAALVGLLPLLEQRERGVRSWRLMGTGIVGSDYLGLVARRGLEAEVAEAVGGHLAEAARRGRFDLLELDDLDEDAPATGALLHALEAAFPGRPLRRLPGHPCPFVPKSELVPFPGKHLLEVDPELAGQLRRKRRWLERRPGYRLDRRRGEQACQALETWMTLHRRRWAQAGGSDALADERTEAFHREVARRLAARDRLRLDVIEVDGVAVAALYGFQRGPKSYFYQSGFEPSWGRRSVGGILLALSMEDAAERGAAEMDLLRGAERYKFRFASGLRHTFSLRVAVSPVGRLALEASGLWAGARAAVKAALPERWRRPVVHAVRRLRGVPVSSDALATVEETPRPGVRGRAMTREGRAAAAAGPKEGR